MLSRMNKLVGMFLLSLLIGSACSTRERVARHEPRPLRVVTWNVHGCANGVDAIVDELRRLDPDVICLQEAWVADGKQPGSDQPLGNTIDQPAQIAEALGMRHFSAGSALPDGTEQRMAILTREEMTNTEALDAGTGRIYGVAASVRWGERPIRIVSIHLTSSYRFDLRHALETSWARYTEARHLNALLTGGDIDTIVAGDFNCLPGMPARELIVRDLAPSETTTPTYPSKKPAVALDHIYHTKGLRTQSLTVPRSLASDHLPVVTTIGLGQSNEE